ncbi:hypothetical protein Noda2021_06560 [Candidatus Dependentiae bacterium Noda2021]|nr:hypothetical protein Noda2021_06560 [Candidatus Dependentiae bacterium Noda2021]
MMKKIFGACVILSAVCNAMEDNNKTQISFPDKVLLNIFCQAGAVVDTTDQALEVFKALQLTCKLGTNKQLMANFENTVTGKFKSIKKRIKFIERDIKDAKLEKKYVKQYAALHDFDDRRLEEKAFSSYRDNSVQKLEKRYEKELNSLYEQQAKINKFGAFFHFKRNFDYFMRLEKQKANRNQ